MIGDPRFNSNNLVYLADGVGLPGVITIVLLILGMLQKYVAALAGPEARFCAMLLGLVAGAAYFQVLWVVAYLAGLQRLELRTGPSETAQSKVGKLAAHTPSVIY